MLCVILTLGAFGFTGCGKDSEQGDPGENEVAEQDYRVTLFFANEEYVVMGDEALEKFKVFEKEITAKPGKAYLDALEELRTVPEEGYNTMLYERIKFNDVYLEGDTVYVDINSEGTEWRLSGRDLSDQSDRQYVAQYI